MFSFRFWRFTTARAMQWLGWLATLVMLALLAWLGASMFWSLTKPATPNPAVALETDPVRAAQRVATHHVFGEAAAPSVVAAQASVPDIALRGVIAAARPQQPAVAVLAVSGKAPVSVREGDEVMPGISLRRVLPRQVELERDGRIQSLSLPDRAKSDVDNKAGTGKPRERPPQ